jgi:cysteine desulfuration protein SufE
MLLRTDNDIIDYDILLENLSFIDDWEEKYSYILELGKKLLPFPEKYKNDTFKVKGCVSQVWLYPDIQNNQFYFLGDSDSLLVKGLIAVILIIYNHLSKSEILQINFTEKFKALGLSEHLTPQRSNGVFSMIAKIQEYANHATE